MANTEAGKSPSGREMLDYALVAEGWGSPGPTNDEVYAVIWNEALAEVRREVEGLRAENRHRITKREFLSLLERLAAK